MGKSAESEDYSQEIIQATLKVYDTYRSVLERAKKSPVFIDQFIKQLSKEDASIDKHQLAYAVYRDPATNEIEGVVRVLIAKKGEPDHLLPDDANAPGLRKELAATPTRVILGRLVSVPNGKDTVSKELGYTVAKYLFEVFKSNPWGTFKIYAQTGRSRARLYQQTYKFKLIADPSTTGVNDLYIVGMSGFQFIDIYLGHIHKAYQIGIQQRRPDDALKLLDTFQTIYSLKDYAPSVHARQHLIIMKDLLAGRGVTNELYWKQLGAGDKDDANLDFEIVFYVRANYDMLNYRGDPKTAYLALQKYISELESLGPGQKNRTRYFKQLAAIINAHAGNTADLISIRKFFGDHFFEIDVKEFERFQEDFMKHHPQDFTSLFLLKQKYLDPSFNSFISATNPLIHLFLAEVHKQSQPFNEANMLSYLGWHSILPEEHQKYFDYFQKVLLQLRRFLTYQGRRSLGSTGRVPGCKTQKNQRKVLFS